MKRCVTLILAFLLAFSTPIMTMADEEPVTLTLYWCQLNDEASAGWQHLLEVFHEKNPKYKVDMFCIYNVGDLLRVQVAAGSGPDIMMMDAFDVMDYMKAGYLMNLTDMSERNGWNEKFYRWAQNCCTINGELWAFPSSVEQTFMNYNKTLMEKYGWEVPTTREEFIAVCEAAKAEGIIPVTFGCAGDDLPRQWIYDHYINAYAGSDVLKAVLSNEIPWTDDAIKGSFQCMKDDWDAGYLQEQKCFAISMFDSRAQYFQGQALFETEGTWMVFDSSDEDLFNENLQNGVALWPSFRDGVAPTTSITCGEVIGINANANAAGVEAFLNFLMTDDETICSVVSAGVIPPPREIDWSYLPDDISKASRQALNAISDLQEQTDNIGWAPWGFYPTKANQYMYFNMDKMLLGTMTIDEYLANTQVQFEVDIADGYVFAG